MAGLAAVCVLTGFFTLLGLRHFEVALFPIITDFRVTDVQVTPSSVIVSGAFNKRRPCHLVATTVEYEPADGHKIVLARILPEESTASGVNIDRGKYLWWPFAFKRDPRLESLLKSGGTIRVIGEHQCHILWHQFTEYGAFDASVIGSRL